MTRIIKVKAYQRVMPERAISAIHAQMFEDYETAKMNREIAEDIARALQLDLDGARNQAGVR
jgi:hypothetical protein